MFKLNTLFVGYGMDLSTTIGSREFPAFVGMYFD